MSILTTKELIEKNIKERLNNNIAVDYMIRLIDPVLAEWEGKQVNKRIVSHVITNIGNDFYVYMNKSYYGAYTLHISRGNKSLSVELTPDKNSKKFSIDFFRNRNKWAYEMPEAIKNCEDALKEANTFADDFDRIKSEIKTLQNTMEEKGMRYFVDWRDLIS
jgi:hypothetical protein